MMPEKYIILNFAYGYGPFLRTTELALSVRAELQKATGESYGIIIPWVYGESQKSIMQEQFSDVLSESPDILVLDETLGKHLRSLFFEGDHFGKFLEQYVQDHASVEKSVQEYLNQGLSVHSFDGREVQVSRSNIALEISRAPRLAFGIAPAYYTTFGYISEILERAAAHGSTDVDGVLLEKATQLQKNIEQQYDLHFVADPATFSHLETRSPRYETEIFTPPNAALPPLGKYDNLEPGIYVTVTGIPGLEHLLKEAQEIGLKIYSNKENIVPGAIRVEPNVLFHDNIVLHFARSGWGSIWLSLFTGKPFIAPQYTRNDDPEIYFNNACIEALQIGKVYRGEAMSDLLEFRDTYIKRAEEVKKELHKKYGTHDGIDYTTQKIIEHFLKKNI